jgi:hypothetical protein
MGELKCEISFWRALLALGWRRGFVPWGAPPAGTYFKMRGRGAFSRDAQAGRTGDKEHYACAS